MAALEESLAAIKGEEASGNGKAASKPKRKAPAKRRTSASSSGKAKRKPAAKRKTKAKAAK
jgi:hypothetical protein